MTYPLSPSSSTSGQTHSQSMFGPTSAPQTRICRSLAVESVAHDLGVRSSIYCRVSLPVNPTIFPTQHHFLTLTPLSHLLHHSTYPLPLRFSLSSSSSEAIQAARVLGIPLLEGDHRDVEAGAATVGRAEGRKGGGVFPSSTTGEPTPEIKLKQEDKQISLWLDPRTTSTSPTSDASPLIHSGGRKRAGSTGAAGEDKLEWIVVLRVESSHGGLCPPLFATTIAIPIPPCLRNALSFTLPPLPDISSPWDLSVRPRLRSNTSSTFPAAVDGSSDRRIQGTFTATPLLNLMWTPRHLSDSPLVISKASLDVRWGIGDLGYGRVEVKVRGAVEQYQGLREKGTVDLAIDLPPADGDSTRAFEVVDAKGDVLGWEIVKEPWGNQDDTRTEREMRTDEQSTPVVRRRPPKGNGPLPVRPPSFTSLFDTQEPVPPPLDPSTLEKLTVPSLLGTEAPFEGNSDLDMTFELGSSISSSETPSPAAGATTFADAPPSQSEPAPLPTFADLVQPTFIRIQVPLSSILVPASLPNPEFTFTATLTFPSVSLLSLFVHTAFSTGAIEAAPLRLALPTFSLPVAQVENAVVTVSAGHGGFVELVGSIPLKGQDSPLPASDGKARWRTRRSKDEDWMATRRSRAGSEHVEVEVSLPPPRVVLVDEIEATRLPFATWRTSSPSPSPPLSPRRTAQRRPLRVKASFSSLAPSASILSSMSGPSTFSLIKIRITPIPPTAPHLPWRFFSHVNFPTPYEGAFELPLRPDVERQSVEVCAAWDEEALELELETELLDMKGDARRLRVAPTEEGVREALYVVKEFAGPDGDVNVGDVLVRMSSRIAEFQVEVLDVAGYELQTDQQTFDMASPRVTGSSRTFTKFLVPPSSTSCLGATLRAIEQAVPSPPPPPHRMVKSWTDPPEATPTSSRSLFTIIGLLFACLAVTLFLLAYDSSSLAAIHPTASPLVNPPPVTWHAPIEPLAASDVFLDEPFVLSPSPPSPPPDPLPITFADDLPPALNETQAEPYEPKAGGLSVLFHVSEWDWDAPIRLGLRGREIVENVWRWVGDVVRRRRPARA